jgi:hypothetical protein
LKLESTEVDELALGSHKLVVTDALRLSRVAYTRFVALVIERHSAHRGEALADRRHVDRRAPAVRNRDRAE